MHDQRLIDRLTNYWNAVRKDAIVPEFNQFNVGAIEDIWNQCVLFTVQHSANGLPPTIHFYRIGDKLSAIYNPNMVGRSMKAGQKHFQGASIVRKIGEVIEIPTLIQDQGQFINEHSKVVKYRSCMLPFGTKEGKVTHVVAGLSWREF